MTFLSLIASCCALLTTNAPEQGRHEIKPVRSIAYFKRHIWPKIEREKSLLPANVFFVEDPKKVYPEGSILIKSNNAQGTLSIIGPPEKAKEVYETLGFFNVEPRKIKLTIRADIVGEGTDTETTVVIDNNNGWSFTDEVTELELMLRPRINDDGTTTIVFESSYRGTKSRSTVRIADGKTYSAILPGESGPVPLDSKTTSLGSPQTKAQPGDLRVLITPSLMPPAKS